MQHQKWFLDLVRLQFTQALAPVHDNMSNLSRRAHPMAHGVQPLAAAAATMSSLSISDIN